MSALPAFAKAAGTAEERIVLQIEPDGGDCILAALATALGRSYGDIASLLRIDLDPLTGGPFGLKETGIDGLSIGAPLLAAGIASTLVWLPPSPGETAPRDVTELRTILEGRRALVVADSPQDGPDRGHALAWTGDRLIDCRGPTAREIDLRTLPIFGVFVLTQEVR